MKVEFLFPNTSLLVSVYILMSVGRGWSRDRLTFPERKAKLSTAMWSVVSLLLHHKDFGPAIYFPFPNIYPFIIFTPCVFCVALLRDSFPQEQQQQIPLFFFLSTTT